MNTGNYSKGIISAIGTILLGLNARYPSGTYWVPIVTSALATLGVVMIPNTGADKTPDVVSQLVAGVEQVLKAYIRPAPPRPPAPPAPAPAPVPAPQPAVQPSGAPQ